MSPRLNTSKKLSSCTQGLQTLLSFVDFVYHCAKAYLLLGSQKSKASCLGWIFIKPQIKFELKFFINNLNISCSLVLCSKYLLNVSCEVLTEIATRGCEIVHNPTESSKLISPLGVHEQQCVHPHPFGYRKFPPIIQWPLSVILTPD